MLSICLIGLPEFYYSEKALSIKGKPAALLALIAAHQPTGIGRVQAERYLWGRDAAQNLRQAIYNLRQLPFAHDWLVVSDLLLLQNYKLITPETDQELLQGMDALLSEEGLEWLSIGREKQRLERRENLLQSALQTQGQTQIELLEKLNALDPLHESAVQLLISAHSKNQARAKAIEVFERFKTNLRNELGGEPLPATIALLESNEVRFSIPDLERLKRAYAVVGILDTVLIAKLLERDELEVAEALTGVELPNVEQARTQTPKAIWQLLNRRAAQALSYLPERAAQHWLEAGESERAATAFLDLAEQRFGADLSQSLALSQKVLAGKVSIQMQLKAFLLQQRIYEIQANWQALETLVEQLFVLARQNQNDDIEFAAHQTRASWLLRIGQPQAALESSADALRAAKRLNDTVKLEQICLLQGTAYLQMGNFIEAKSILKSLVQASAIGTRLSANSNLGAIEGLSNHLETALDYFEHALQLARQTQNLAISARVVQNIATTAEKLERFERAKTGWREAIQIAEKISDSHSLGVAYANLALTHFKAGQVGLAMNTALETLEIEPLSSAARFTVLNTQAAVWRYVADVPAALASYQSALELAQSQQNARWIADTQCNLAFMAWLADPSLEPAFLASLASPTTANVIEEMKLEYGLYSHSPIQIRALLPENLERPRRRLIQAIIEVRLSILEQKNTTVQLEALLNAEPFLETRLGWVVLAQWLEQHGLDSRYARTKANQVFAEQCQGLPREIQTLTLD